MTSPAVQGPSEDSSRLEVRLHWRLRRESWGVSNGWKANECEWRHQQQYN